MLLLVLGAWCLLACVVGAVIGRCLAILTTDETRS
jgi:hypothetical protein